MQGRMNDNNNQNRDKSQDERFLNGDFFSLKSTKDFFDSNENQRWMVAPKSCHECVLPRWLLLLDLVVSAMHSALHSNLSVLSSDIQY